MNLTIFCLATLNQKLKKICSGGPLFLSIQSLTNNKGIARLKIVCPEGVKIEDIEKIGDTNIMLKIDSVSEDIKDLGKEIPVQNLYASGEKIENNKLAITDVDSEIKKYKNKKLSEKNINHKISNDNKKELKNFVSSYDDLVRLISAIKDIDTPISQVSSNKKMNKVEAIEFEKTLASIPKLPIGVYVSNELNSRLCVDDLNLVFAINEIKNLSSIFAQKIKNSNQLRICCEKEFIKFRSKGEFEEWYKKQADNVVTEDENISLEIFDCHEDAIEQTEAILSSTNDMSKKNNIKTQASAFINKKNIIKQSKKDLLIKREDDEFGGMMEVSGDEETEEEKEIKNLIKDLPPEKRVEDIELGNNIKSKVPLLSDEVKDAEQNKIKRI